MARDDGRNGVRFAVYALPSGAFGKAGAAWLGWDAARGVSVDQPVLPDLPRPLSALTHAARRYGFHATIKPPMRPMDGVTQADLLAALRGVAGGMVPVDIELRIGDIAGFMAFLPAGDPQPLCDLAARVVRDLDQLRAPLTDTEIARRNPAALSSRQAELLHSFGYPFVLDQFQPHFTLTDGLTQTERQPIAAAAARHFDVAETMPYRLDTLALMAEGRDGFFRLAGTAGLAGGSQRT